MIDREGFRAWLDKTELSPKMKTDILSRMTRADRILAFTGTEDYLTALQQTDEFQNLTMYVRSQLRRAVRLYTEFQNE